MVRQHYSGHFRLGRVGRLLDRCPVPALPEPRLKSILRAAPRPASLSMELGIAAAERNRVTGQVVALCRRRAFKGRRYGRRRNNLNFR
jgi:hypothetical protein